MQLAAQVSIVRRALGSSYKVTGAVVVLRNATQFAALPLPESRVGMGKNAIVVVFLRRLILGLNFCRLLFLAQYFLIVERMAARLRTVAGIDDADGSKEVRDVLPYRCGDGKNYHDHDPASSRRKALLAKDDLEVVKALQSARVAPDPFPVCCCFFCFIKIFHVFVVVCFTDNFFGRHNNIATLS